MAAFISLIAWGVNAAVAYCMATIFIAIPHFIKSRFPVKSIFYFTLLSAPNLYHIQNVNPLKFVETLVFVISSQITIYLLCFNSHQFSKTSKWIYWLSGIFLLAAIVWFALDDTSQNLKRFSFFYDRPTKLVFVVVFINCLLLQHPKTQIAIFLSIFCLFIIYVSGTKKELAVSIFLLATLLYRLKPRIIPVMIFATIALLIGVNSGELMSHLRLNAGSNLLESGSRLLLWQEGFKTIINHPTGIGLGNWDHYLPDYGLDSKEYGGPHNGLLYSLGNFGVVFAPSIILGYFILIKEILNLRFRYIILSYFLLLEIFSVSMIYSGDIRSMLFIYLVKRLMRKK